MDVILILFWDENLDCLDTLKRFHYFEGGKRGEKTSENSRWRAPLEIALIERPSPKRVHPSYFRQFKVWVECT